MRISHKNRIIVWFESDIVNCGSCSEVVRAHVATNLEWLTLRSTFSQTVGVAVNENSFGMRLF